MSQVPKEERVQLALGRIRNDTDVLNTDGMLLDLLVNLITIGLRESPAMLAEVERYYRQVDKQADEDAIDDYRHMIARHHRERGTPLPENLDDLTLPELRDAWEVLQAGEGR